MKDGGGHHNSSESNETDDSCQSRKVHCVCVCVRARTDIICTYVYFACYAMVLMHACTHAHTKVL